MDTPETVVQSTESFIESTKAKRSTAPAAPYPPAITDPLLRSLHPDYELDMNLQISMDHDYSRLGYIGFERCVRNVAAEQNKQTPHESWQYVLDLYAQHRPAVRLMPLSMHPRIIEALIRGNLMYQFCNDGEFASSKQTSIEWTTKPGIYLNVLCRAEMSNIGNTQQYAKDPSKSLQHSGKGLSYKELLNVLDIVELYLGGSDGSSIKSASSIKQAKKIDGELDAPLKEDRVANIDYNQTRRYCKSQSQRRRIMVWVKSLRRYYQKRALAMIGTPQEYLFDQLMRRALSEVGFGKNCRGRAKEHLANSNTNYLFGLIQAILQAAYPGVFELQQVQVLKIIEPEHANLGEVLVSILASSYASMGGLNPVLAGAAKLAELKDPSNKHLFDWNREAVLTSDVIKKSFDANKAKLKKTKELLDMFEDIDDTRAALKHKQDITDNKLSDLLDKARIVESLGRVKEIDEAVEALSETSGEPKPSPRVTNFVLPVRLPKTPGGTPQSSSSRVLVADSQKKA